MAQSASVPTQPEAAPTTKYDNRYEIYGGMAYSHFKAGPNLLQGANLGGFDAQGTRWFNSRWGAMANARGYYGTTGVVPNHYNIMGPFVSEHVFVAGPEMMGVKNEHGAITLHTLVGGAYGYFDGALQNGHGSSAPTIPPGQLGLFENQFGFAAVLGGTIDLNRSPKWALRISPDDVLTRYGGQVQNNFAISVGVLYRFSKKR